MDDLHHSLVEAFGLAVDSHLRLLSKGKAIAVNEALANAAGLKAGSTIVCSCTQTKLFFSCSLTPIICGSQMVMYSRTDEIKQVMVAQPERMRGFEEDDERQAAARIVVAALVTRIVVAALLMSISG